MRQRAVRFLEKVVDDSEKAEEFDNMTTEEYAERKRIRLTNPLRDRALKRKEQVVKKPKSRTELQDRIAELEEENRDLRDKIDGVLEVIDSEDGDNEEDDD